MKEPFNFSLGSSGFENKSEGILIWRKCNTDIIDIGSLPLNIK
jgi:hypothetical protein